MFILVMWSQVRHLEHVQLWYPPRLDHLPELDLRRRIISTPQGWPSHEQRSLVALPNMYAYAEQLVELSQPVFPLLGLSCPTLPYGCSELAPEVALSEQLSVYLLLCRLCCQGSYPRRLCCQGSYPCRLCCQGSYPCRQCCQGSYSCTQDVWRGCIHMGACWCNAHWPSWGLHPMSCVLSGQLPSERAAASCEGDRQLLMRAWKWSRR